MNKKYQKLIRQGWYMVQFRTERHYYPPGFSNHDFIHDIIYMDERGDQYCFTVNDSNLESFLEYEAQNAHCNI